MRYIDNLNTNPYFNLATEEYLLKHTHEEYFMLWRNESCIVVGKNQNTLSEINEDYVGKHNIKVVRRLTGGGAVFHDLGNINFTFIVNDGGSFNDFYKFVEPIIEVLATLGVKAEFSGRNDLLIEGKKFSGNAQCKHKDRVMHHGTLLFSSSMTDLSAALIAKPIKFSDKSVKSISSRVTNISEHLGDSSIDVLRFKELVFEHLALKKGAIIEELNEQETEYISKLKEDKYSTWDWNFGKSPKYNFKQEKKFQGGTVESNIEVQEGIIKEIKIFGDFFGKEDIKFLENKLIGIKHERSAILKALEDVDISRYMSNISKENLLEVLF
ncbi:lipoate--protein ligase [Clostridium amazonitimonense]|uniref:lipoate--protein ligase n=1 Tax=Clostridium amazonitimonense TaxID=1499689 RepID=UPI0005098D13|nr:lipoate--protein ligase [Clostridium amazonitimonense]